MRMRRRRRRSTKGLVVLGVWGVGGLAVCGLSWGWKRGWWHRAVIHSFGEFVSFLFSSGSAAWMGILPFSLHLFLPLTLLSSG